MTNANLRGEYLHPTLSDRFLTEARASGRLGSDGTVLLYRSTYRRLQAAHEGLRAAEILNEDTVVAWFRSHPEWVENTVATYRKAMTAIVKWAARQGVCQDFTEALRERIQVKIRTHRVNNWLEADEVGLLLGACDDGTLTGERDAMLIRLGVLTGLRASELASLRWADVNLKAHTIRVVEGKGNKERFVGVLAELEPDLRAWRTRAAEDLGALPTSHPVIPRLESGGRAGGRRLFWDRRKPITLAQQALPKAPVNGFEGISDNVAYSIVRDRGRLIGIQHLGPHDLRRTFAGLLEQAGVPVQEIAAQLGHSSVDTTIRYLASNPAKRASAMANVRFGI